MELLKWFTFWFTFKRVFQGFWGLVHFGLLLPNPRKPLKNGARNGIRTRDLDLGKIRFMQYFQRLVGFGSLCGSLLLPVSLQT